MALYLGNTLIYGVATGDAATSENLDTELSTQDSLISQIAAALEGKTAGGGSVKTCTVQFSFTNGARIDYGAYMKYENGKASFVEMNSTSSSITLENVVCDSVMWVYFNSPNGAVDCNYSSGLRSIGGCCTDYCFHVEDTATNCTVSVMGW